MKLSTSSSLILASHIKRLRESDNILDEVDVSMGGIRSGRDARIFSDSIRTTRCRIENLFLSHTGLHDEWVREILDALGVMIQSSMRNGPHLKQLSFGYNNISDRGMIYVVKFLSVWFECLKSKITPNISHEKLYLYNNKFGDDGVVVLAKFLKGVVCDVSPHSSCAHVLLEELDLYGNKFGIIGINALADVLRTSGCVRRTIIHNTPYTSSNPMVVEIFKKMEYNSFRNMYILRDGKLEF